MVTVDACRVVLHMPCSAVNNVCLVVHQLMKACVDTMVKGYTTRVVTEAPSLIQNNEVPSEYCICTCSCKQYTRVSKHTAYICSMEKDFISGYTLIMV